MNIKELKDILMNNVVRDLRSRNQFDPETLGKSAYL